MPIVEPAKDYRGGRKCASCHWFEARSKMFTVDGVCQVQLPSFVDTWAKPRGVIKNNWCSLWTPNFASEEL